MKKKSYISPIIKRHQLSSHIMVIQGSESSNSQQEMVVGKSYSSPQEVADDPNASRSWRNWEDDY